MKSKSNTIIMIALIVLNLINCVWSIALGLERIITIVTLLAELVALCLALYYTLKGYGKNVAASYKVFMHLLAFIFLTPVILSTITASNGSSIIVTAIMVAVAIFRSYLCLCLALVSYLGKQKSMFYVYF